MSRWIGLMLAVSVAVCSCQPAFAWQTPQDSRLFSREVLPILSDRCFHCHGPDESAREAGLRLDVERLAKEDLGGYAAVTPGDLEASEIWLRINSDDEYEQMPPPDSHRKPLTEAEREVIRQWILAGAPWGKHWAFERIARPPLPAGSEAENPVDAFIQEQLEQRGLTPSPPALPHRQLRRLSLALTGLAPTPEAIQEFESDSTDAAWQSAVDRMLESPRTAERLAMWWLDAARYSDSDGFQQDATRQNWPWRDWVIDAFARNQPFDQFTVEQFAGDLLPAATDEQILATCFHRNHMTNGEGGRDPAESRVDYVIDRVNTTGTVWLGLTLGCTQCHSHKFDPISQADYYALSAFFNSIDEDGRAGGGAKPYLKYASPAAQPAVEELQQAVELWQQQERDEKVAARQRFESWLERQRPKWAESYQAWRSPRPEHCSCLEGTTFEIHADAQVSAGGPDVKHADYRVHIPIPAEMKQVTGWRIEIFPDDSHVAGKWTPFGTGDFTLTAVKIGLGGRAGDPAEAELAINGAVASFEADPERESSWDRGYSKISQVLNDDARNGWSTEGAQAGTTHVGVFRLEEPWHVQPEDRMVVVLQHRSTHGHANLGRFRISLTDEPGQTLQRVDGGSPIQDWLNAGEAAEQQAAANREAQLFEQFLLSDDAYQQVWNRLTIGQSQLAGLRDQTKPRSVMVLRERNEPRETHVLVRGVWDAHGQVVQRAALPAVLDWPAEKMQTRLDLAKWLVDRDNPLTARVIVNQLWQLMMGQGLVRTPEDFGLQGQRPTHPELLDWLAVELVESGWDLRHVLRLIARSQTFRQSSRVSPELLELDPKNRWLARAPKFRLPAWMLRDNALQVSGLLVNRVGGPPVFPYQPPGVWSEITMGRFRYQASLGPAQYRRTIYAFWRRSSAPTFLFDAAQRRVCEVGVRQTNTPLQALTLMNDRTMLEASRALADSAHALMAAEGNGFDDALQQIAMRILSRKLETGELNTLERVHDSAVAYYLENAAAASAYTAVGQQTPVPDAGSAAEVAAWMTVCNLMLNLDEAISYE